MEGFIKLHRKIIDWEWYNDTKKFKVFLHLLLTANYEDKEWHGIKVKRGQRVISIRKFAEEVNLSVKELRGTLGALKRTHELDINGHTTYTLVTIVNYEKYQLNENEKGTQRAQIWAQKGHTNGQLLKNKEDKNKEIYKEINRQKMYLVDDRKKDLDNVYEN